MSLLDKAALLAAAAQKLPIEKVDVPELGGHVFIRGMSGTERDGWETSLVTGRGKNQRINTENVRAKLLVRVLCDEHGTRLFDNGDAVALGGLRVDVLTSLYEVAQRLSGVSDKDVDELGKASAPEGGSDSPTN
jgi:hypothetical protein